MLSIFHNTVSGTDLAASDFHSTAWTDTGLGLASDIVMMIPAGLSLM